MSFDRRELMLLFRSLVEDILFGVTERKVGKYKHSTKESVNANRVKDSKCRDARLNFINAHRVNSLRHLPPTRTHTYQRVSERAHRPEPQRRPTARGSLHTVHRAARSAQPISCLYKVTFFSRRVPVRRELRRHRSSIKKYI